MRKILSVLCLLILMAACKDKDVLLPGSTGTPYELLVVMERDQWQGAGGRALFELLDADMPGLPQSEPCFKISYATPDRLGALLKPVRNIVIATINPEQFTRSGMTYTKDLWATDQLVVKINAPDSISFAACVKENGAKIVKAFVDHEIGKAKEQLLKRYNRTMSDTLRRYLGGIDMRIPFELNAFKKGKDFFWVSNAGAHRRDILVYTYPYADTNTFTVDYLIHKRDSVLKENIPGGPEGSYMSTQSVYRPDSSILTIDGKYCMELRGLWEVVGDNMGGPFVSHTQIDEVNNRVVTVEAFLYAPDKKKRTLMRSLEAALYTLQLPSAYMPNEKKGE